MQSLAVVFRQVHLIVRAGVTRSSGLVDKALLVLPWMLECAFISTIAHCSIDRDLSLIPQWCMRILQQPQD